MAISTRDGLVAAMASAQLINWFKSASRTTSALTWFSIFDLTGQPGAGVLAGTSTAAGVVPDSTVAGFPTINAFGGSNTGYLAHLEFGNTVACRMRLCDMLFKAGAYTFSASQTLASQPSYSARIPSGNYAGTQIWIEGVTAFTGSASITVTYTNDQGATGHTTGAINCGALGVGQLKQLPLAAGDAGVQKIESVTCTTATAGTFNVLVLRPLSNSMRCRLANDGAILGPDLLSLPIVFQLSALYVMITTDSTSSGVPELSIGIVNG